MRASKIIGISTVALAIIIFLSSCASYVVRAYPGHVAVLTGRLVFIPGEDPVFPVWDHSRWESVDVIVRNADTGAVYVIRTDRAGYFRFARLPFGPYVITGYSYRILTPRGLWVRRMYVPRTPYRFVIREGAGADIGTITWYAESGRVREWDGR